MKTWRVDGDPSAGVIDELAAVLNGGGVALFPTDTIYGLHAVATDEKGVSRIAAIKQRPADKRFVIIAASVDQLRTRSSESDLAGSADGGSRVGGHDSRRARATAWLVARPPHTHRTARFDQREPKRRSADHLTRNAWSQSAKPHRCTSRSGPSQRKSFHDRGLYRQ